MEQHLEERIEKILRKDKKNKRHSSDERDLHVSSSAKRAKHWRAKQKEGVCKLELQLSALKQEHENLLQKNDELRTELQSAIKVISDKNSKTKVDLMIIQSACEALQKKHFSDYEKRLASPQRALHMSLPSQGTASACNIETLKRGDSPSSNDADKKAETKKIPTLNYSPKPECPSEASSYEYISRMNTNVLFSAKKKSSVLSWIQEEKMKKANQPVIPTRQDQKLKKSELLLQSSCKSSQISDKQTRSDKGSLDHQHHALNLREMLRENSNETGKAKLLSSLVSPSSFNLSSTLYDEHAENQASNSVFPLFCTQDALQVIALQEYAKVQNLTNHLYGMTSLARVTGTHQLRNMHNNYEIQRLRLMCLGTGNNHHGIKNDACQLAPSSQSGMWPTLRQITLAKLIAEQNATRKLNEILSAALRRSNSLPNITDCDNLNPLNIAKMKEKTEAINMQDQKGTNSQAPPDSCTLLRFKNSVPSVSSALNSREKAQNNAQLLEHVTRVANKIDDKAADNKHPSQE